MNNVLFKNAIALTRRDFAVIPLRQGAKEPLGSLVPRGAHDASADPETIRRWWSLSPYANVGATLAGRVIIDQDDRNGGDASLHALETRFGPLPNTWRSLTAGGEHYWFDLPDGANIRGGNDKLGLGLDVKCGPGSYAVAPPSLHPIGVRYQWRRDAHPAETPLALAPSWLIGLLTPPPPLPPKPFAPRSDNDRRIADALQHIPSDDREIWLRVGMALHGHYGPGAFGLWDAWSKTSTKYDCKTCERVWKSFGRANGRPVGLGTIFHIARENARAA